MTTIKPTIGALAVSIVIMLLFAADVMGLATPSAVASSLLDNAVVLVIGYWLGSSSGSHTKDETAATAANTAAVLAAKAPGGTVP